MKTLVPGTTDEITLKASGRTVRTEFGGYSFDPEQARDLAVKLQSAVSYIDRLPQLHEAHVNYKLHCPLCVAEAGPGHQWSAEDYEEDEDAD